MGIFKFPLFFYIFVDRMESIEVKNMENLLISFLGEPKSRLGGEIEGQRLFCCPKCAEENGGVPDGKYNLEINISKNLKNGGVFQCWKCGSYDDTMKGTVLKLIRRYGGSTVYRQYKAEISSLINARLYNLDAFSGSTYQKQTVHEEIHLPKTYKKIELNKYCKNAVREYVENRGITQDIIDRYNIGYTEYEEDDKSWSYRIIIPSYDEYGELNYFVGRDYMPDKNEKLTKTDTSSPLNGYTRSKYKNCKVDKKEIIFQESQVDWDGDIILVEGAIDCLFFNGNSISMLGKKLDTDYKLYQDIMDKANGKVIICLDSDTRLVETKKIYNLLNKGRLRGKIRYIRLEKYKDFGEVYENEGKKGIIEAIKSAKEFKEIELLYD